MLIKPSDPKRFGGRRCLAAAGAPYLIALALIPMALPRPLGAEDKPAKVKEARLRAIAGDITKDVASLAVQQIGASPTWKDVQQLMAGQGNAGAWGPGWMSVSIGGVPVSLLSLDQAYDALRRGERAVGNVVSGTGDSMGDLGLGQAVANQVVLLESIEAAGGFGSPQAQPLLGQLGTNIARYYGRTMPSAEDASRGYWGPATWNRVTGTQEAAVGPGAGGYPELGEIMRRLGTLGLNAEQMSRVLGPYRKANDIYTNWWKVQPPEKQHPPVPQPAGENPGF